MGWVRWVDTKTRGGVEQYSAQHLESLLQCEEDGEHNNIFVGQVVGYLVMMIMVVIFVVFCNGSLLALLTVLFRHVQFVKHFQLRESCFASQYAGSAGSFCFFHFSLVSLILNQTPGLPA